MYLYLNSFCRPCHQTLPDVTDFDYSVLELNCTDTNNTNIPPSSHVKPANANNVWSVSDLSTLLTQSTHATQLANNLRQNHVRYALHETVETCSAIFHLLQRSAFSQALLYATNHPTTSSSDLTLPTLSILPTFRIRLSFPSMHATTEMTCDATQSLALLTTWSCSAADSFEGQFVLEAGCTVEQALK